MPTRAGFCGTVTVIVCFPELPVYCRFRTTHPLSTFVAYSDRIATIGWTEVARRAAGRPASSATETAIAEAPA